MHEHLRSFEQNSYQKFCKYLIKFEKSQNLSKPPKVRSKAIKCMIKWEKRIIQEEENDLEPEDWVGKRFRVRKVCLGRWGVKKSKERLRKMSEKSRWRYI